MGQIKNFINKNYKTILLVMLGLFILYWVIFLFTPSNTMSPEDKAKIETLNNKIDSLSKSQNILETKINTLDSEIEKIDDNILKIKSNKDKTGKKYHEEINRVDKYSERELDDFFSKRYK